MICADFAQRRAPKIKKNFVGAYTLPRAPKPIFWGMQILINLISISAVL